MCARSCADGTTGSAAGPCNVETAAPSQTVSADEDGSDMTMTNGHPSPDFIIIGSMKSGTTSLYRMLASHPDIGMSRDKETDFFIVEKNYGRGIDWYRAQFDPSRTIHGEASPNYTKVDDFGGVPERIRAALPEVKLIYLVRDPVDRLVSQYRHSWTMGDITMTPEELPSTPEWRHIIDTSRYGRQFKAFLDVFPDEQILVVDFDRLIGEPQAVLDEVLAFIGAPPFSYEAGKSFNENAELSRVPAPILRFAQSPAGRAVTRFVSRENRDRLRKMMARGKARQPDRFPDPVLDQARRELAGDAEEFRRMTGMAFPGWSV